MRFKAKDVLLPAAALIITEQIFFLSREYPLILIVLLYLLTK